MLKFDWSGSTPRNQAESDRPLRLALSGINSRVILTTRGLGESTASTQSPCANPPILLATEMMRFE
jgi:hypothetical protein